MRATLWPFVVLALAAQACGGEAVPRDPAPKTPPQPAAPAPAPAPVEQEPRPKRTLTRPELQQLLDAWLAAQNAGDFAAYEALYAPRMRGVKRVGERETRMDRAQWMSDRARMFKKKMEVAIHSVTFRALDSAVMIEFVQVFHSGTFMDSGPKRLVVAMHEGQPRIVHEEMLRSEVVLQADAFHDRAHVVFEVGDAWYVLLGQTAEPSWGTGDFVDRDPSEAEAYTQAVDLGLVPQAQHWLDRPLRVYDAKGAACSARVQELVLMLVGDSYLEDEPHIARLQGAAAVDARARAILRDEPAMLVGKLSACHGVIARPHGEPEPSFYLRLPNDAALEQAVIAAARELPKYKALQAEWEAIWRSDVDEETAANDDPGAWDDSPWVAFFGAADGTRFALIAFGGSDGAGPIIEQLFALYGVDAQGALTLKRTASTTTSASLLVDLNADQIPEIFNAGLYAFGGNDLLPIQYLRSYFSGCGH